MLSAPGEPETQLGRTFSVSFFLTLWGRRPCGLPDEFGLSPAWVHVICCLARVAHWLFKPCAMELEKAGLSCGDLQQGLHPGDAEAAPWPCSRAMPRVLFLFSLNLLRGAREANSSRMTCSSWDRGFYVKERMKPLWLAKSADWPALGSGGRSPLKSSPR